ncbi:MAG: flagellar hook-associated protein FlgL [Fimbriimonadaceae bacterium]|nr:flagellar hook-associated protein FlgL [Fimbriimonadaceae bacterium]
MRISTAYQYETYSRDIAKAQESYLAAQRAVTTGKRVNQPSDDPFGTGNILKLGNMRDASNQYMKNLQTGATFMKFTESALEETVTGLRRAYQLAVSGANGATDQTSRVGMVEEIQQIQKRLLDTANSRGPNGKYLFAGQTSDQQPLTLVGGVVQVNGGNTQVFVESAPGQTIQINSVVAQKMADAYNNLEELKNHLTSGDTGALSGIDIPALQGAMDGFNYERGKVGAKLKEVETGLAMMQRRSDEFTKAISDTEEVDMAEAIMKYQAAETAYTAALNVASQGFRLSLMDFIQ